MNTQNCDSRGSPLASQLSTHSLTHTHSLTRCDHFIHVLAAVCSAYIFARCSHIFMMLFYVIAFVVFSSLFLQFCACALHTGNISATDNSNNTNICKAHIVSVRAESEAPLMSGALVAVW